MMSCIFAVFSLCATYANAAIFDEVWMSAIVNKTAMELNVVQKVTFSASSWIVCSAIASPLTWAWLVCFSESNVGSECQIWSLLDVKNGNGELSGTAGDTPCKLRKSFTGCYKPDDTMAAYGEVYADNFCPDDLTQECTEEFGPKLIIPPKENTCPSNFMSTTAGCIHMTSSTMTWCAGRKFCFDSGGDLYSADTAQDFTDLREYLEAYDPTAGDIWVGVVKIDDKWQWLGNGRSPGRPTLDDWTSEDPNGNGDMCSRVANSAYDFKIGDRECSTSLKILCQVMD